MQREHAAHGPRYGDLEPRGFSGARRRDSREQQGFHLTILGIKNQAGAAGAEGRVGRKGDRGSEVKRHGGIHGVAPDAEDFPRDDRRARLVGGNAADVAAGKSDGAQGT